MVEIWIHYKMYLFPYIQYIFFCDCNKSLTLKHLQSLEDPYLMLYIDIWSWSIHVCGHKSQHFLQATINLQPYGFIYGLGTCHDHDYILYLCHLQSHIVTNYFFFILTFTYDYAQHLWPQTIFLQWIECVAKKNSINHISRHKI